MLYRDKNGIYWEEKEVAKLSETEIKERGLQEMDFNESVLF